MSSIEYQTPQDFFETLNEEFAFTLDACANRDNAKCGLYFTQQDDSLERDWSGHVVWMNPPYNRDVWKWIRKAYREAYKGATVVALIQSKSSDSEMWHKWVMKASEWRFVRDRLHFRLNGISRRANMSSVVVVFRPFCAGPPVVSGIDMKGRPINVSPD